jgi:hypothetical protein
MPGAAHTEQPSSAIRKDGKLMKRTAPRTSVVAGLTAGLTAGLMAGPFASAAMAAPTATITLNGTSATVSGDNVTVAGGAVTITAPGSYEITGTLNNGSVTVDSATEGAVELILNSAAITNASSSALHVANADAVTVTLPAGTTSSLTDATTYTNAEEPDAALFSTADLTIAGAGTLNVRGNYQDGIVSKDDLVIESGTVTVNAKDDAIRGKDSLTVNGGTINVTSTSGDGLKSNDEEAGKGVVTITNGTITASVGDDAIKGQNVLNISGGTINVPRSFEGLETLELTISGGLINIVSTDDAVNAAEEGLDEFAVSAKAFIRVSGGTIITDSGKDGWDSNGSLTFTGGTAVANGPTSGARGGDGAIDANGTIALNGGTVLGAGMTSLAVFGTTVPTNGQGWVAPVFSTNQQAGTIVHIVSGSTVLASYRAPKTFFEVVFSSNRITNGQSYDVYTGGSVSGTSTGGLYSAGSIAGATKALTVTAGRYGRGRP